MAMEHRTGILSAATINIILATGVFFAPFFTSDTAGIWASNMVAGVLVVALAAYNLYAASQRHTERVYAPAMANILLGLWVLVSGWALAATLALTATNVVLGALLAIVAGYNTWAAHDARTGYVPT